MDLVNVISDLTNTFQSSVWPQILGYIVFLSPLLLCLILAKVFWDLWMRYVRASYLLSQKSALLEIRLPKDQYKSPLAMELFLNTFHLTKLPNWYKKIWLGEVRPFASLELVSIEGQVKFMIWLNDSAKNNVMTSLYASFPGIEIYEREDYARSVHFDSKEQKMWASEFEFTKSDAYPIKTYVDYGLDKDPKEEFKVDPIVPLLEFLGSVGPNQQVWIQFIIRGHTKDHKKAGTWFGSVDKWKEEAQKEVSKILMRDAKTKVAGDPVLDADGRATGFTKSPTISKGEQAIVEALERSITKQAFDVGIRAIYIAKKDFYNSGNIAGITGNMKHFSSEHLNGFKPGSSWLNTPTYPWQDYKDRRKNRLYRWAIMAYKRRSYFHPPFEGKPMVMNTEELATVFHFPGAVAGTPTLDRVPSKKSEAPSNLPI